MEVNVVNSNNFKDFISGDMVLIDFYAVWCGPCKMLSPVIEKIASEDIIKCGKMDIDESLDIAMALNIQAVPYVALFKEGKMVDKQVGYCDYEEMVEFIKKNK